MQKRTLSFIILFFLLIAQNAYAQDIVGKVIGVADGDTITVLQNKKQFKIRLLGIDTPEKRQAFGQKAKAFTSDLVYGKSVKVVQESTDRYNRIVGTVYMTDICVNEELVKNGFAWVYKQYCHKSICTTWLKYEAEARNNKIGLWSQGDPVPPWEFRHPKKKKVKQASKKRNTVTSQVGIYNGNYKSKKFHAPGCRYYNCKNCTMIFNSREEAIQAGYSPCGICKP